MPAEQLEDIEFTDTGDVDMGHMLATVNPEAAAAIDNPPPPPDIATMVVFKPRAGVSRMHRTEFPAIVLGHREDGTLSLLVMMEPEDMIMEERVPFRSHNQDQFCWRYPRSSASDLEDRVAKIEAYLDGEDKLVEDVNGHGERLNAIESVLASDEIETLEQRVEKLEKAAKKAK